MKLIGHIATPYELEAIDRLKAIVMPLVPEPEFGGCLWTWKPNPDLLRIWGKDVPFDAPDLLPHQKGDRIYFQEKWQTPDAAQHWFEIAEIRVVQMSCILIEHYEDAGFVAYSGDLIKYHQQINEQWNAAYPKQLWHSDRWVIILDVRSISPTGTINP